MEELTTFLQQQQIMQIAPAAGDPWIANILFVCESPAAIYFVGNTERLYAQLLLKDERLAFATAWCTTDEKLDRKGIQGVGKARVVEDATEIRKALELYNARFSNFSEQVKEDAVRFDSTTSRVWCIEPEFIKFWNDELYGLNGSKKFAF